jgi:hypothetical protein
MTSQKGSDFCVFDVKVVNVSVLLFLYFRDSNFSYDKIIGDFISILNLIKRQAKGIFSTTCYFFTNFSLIAIPMAHFAFKNIGALLAAFCTILLTNKKDCIRIRPSKDR